MQRICFYFLPFLLLILMGNPVKGQGIEYEVSAGPQITKAILNEYQNGIVSNEKRTIACPRRL